jgi:hypothetical protein
MTTYTGNQGGTFTPVAHATNANNLTLAADTAGDVGTVTMISWGGRGTTSTGYRTRWGRATTNGATPTALTPGSSNSNVTNTCTVNTYGTAPVLAADPTALFAIDWNLVGGGGVIVLPIKGGWAVVGTAAPYGMIACGNIAGADANLSSYSITWEE